MSFVPNVMFDECDDLTPFKDDDTTGDQGGGLCRVWKVKGNAMCVTCGHDPALCATVRLTGDQVVWVFAGGKDGTVAIAQGNPNGW
jgi:hypothetical protein